MSRSRALTRAITWTVPATILGLATVSIYRGLNFVPSGVSNRLVDYAIAILALPLAAGALWTGVRTLRWLGLVLWPGHIGVFASADELTLRLGPFGTKTFDAATLDVRYPFELIDEDEEGGFEAFLPEDQQRATLLPRMLHPRSKAPIHRVILQFSSGTEQDAARCLRPVIAIWQARRNKS